MNPKLDISEVKSKRKFTNNLEDGILLTRRLVYNNINNMKNVPGRMKMLQYRCMYV